MATSARPPQLTPTQAQILNAAAQRPGAVALPLPKGLAGAAATMAVTKMLERGWLEEGAASLRRGDPLRRETGDGLGTTLIATETGLAAVGIEPVVVETLSGLRATQARVDGAASAVQRAHGKQAMLIAMLQAAEGASMNELTAALGWQAHTVRGAMSGALKRKLGLAVASEKIEGRGRVYRILGQQVASQAPKTTDDPAPRAAARHP
jgi:hypothetical protein